MKKILLFAVVLSATFLVAQPKNARYYNKEGWNYLEKRDPVKAMASFKSAVSQNKDYKEALTGLGFSYLMRGAADDAFEIFNNLSKKYPEDEKILLGRAASLGEMGRYEEALNDYARVTEIRGENSEALYGTALIYYRMGKNVQAKRTIDESLRVNPYHYDTLILDARIHLDEQRLDQAEGIIQKAINVRQEFPDAYVQYGKLLLNRYKKESNPAFLSDSREEFNRAISINPFDPESIRMAGIIDLINDDASSARDYFSKALDINGNDFATLYNLGYSYELLANTDKAADFYRRATNLAPDDVFMKSKMQTFLIENNFAFGNPQRVQYARLNYSEYKKNRSRNMSDYALMHLRYCVVLNPMDQDARKELAAFYNIAGFNRLYINELKVIQRLHPDNSNREALNLAVIRRRDRLYNRSGYTLDMPPRNVVKVLVLPFYDRSGNFSMFDKGDVFSDNLVFALSQFGRIQILDAAERKIIIQKMNNYDNISEALAKISDEDIDFIVHGSFNAGKTYIDSEYNIVSNHTGAVHKTFELHESGESALNRINFRAARDIADAVPLRGKILKVQNGEPLVNLGLYDGIEKGANLFVYSSSGNTAKGRRIMLKVKETDTFLSTAAVSKSSEADMLVTGMDVYELKIRRARLIK